MLCHYNCHCHCHNTCLVSSSLNLTVNCGDVRDLQAPLELLSLLLLLASEAYIQRDRRMAHLRGLGVRARLSALLRFARACDASLRMSLLRSLQLADRIRRAIADFACTGSYAPLTKQQVCAVADARVRRLHCCRICASVYQFAPIVLRALIAAAIVLRDSRRVARRKVGNSCGNASQAKSVTKVCCVLLHLASA